MNLDVALSILRDRKIAYAITDDSLRVIEIRDVAGILAGPRGVTVGCSLMELVPELVGSESMLEAVLAGQRVWISW